MLKHPAHKAEPTSLSRREYQDKLEAEIKRLGNTTDFPILTKPLVDPILGIMSADQIKQYAEDARSKMITGLKKDNIKTCSYKMQVGDEYTYNGDVYHLLRESDVLRIPPFEVVVVKTREVLNLPRFVAARWNITVGNAYKGLLWAGGPQVDPGWVGHLFCPIYNLSNSPVDLKIGDELASIDFVPARPPTAEYEYARPGSAAFAGKPKSIIIDMYPRIDSGLVQFAATLRSELENVGEMRERLDAKMNHVEEHVRHLTTWNTVILSLMGSALLAKVGYDYAARDSPSLWILAGPFIFAAFVGGIAMLFKKR